MRLGDRLRRDLARRNLVVGREELPIVVIGSIAVILVAQLSEPGSASELGALIVAGLALVARGLAPDAPPEPFAALVIAGAGVAVASGALEVGFFLVPLMTVYCAWSVGSLTRTVVITLAACAVIGVVSTIGGIDGMSPMPWLTAEIFTMVLGRTLYRQHALIAELERARVALADVAVAEERRRIARELHDLTGHTLAAVLLHVTGARHVLRRDRDEAERALLDAESVGRQSMEQIRATVAALRTTERGIDPPLADSEQLPALIDEYRRAGLTIDAHVAAAVHELHGPVGVALHRIGREALANVARHAPGNEVVVRADVDAERATVRLDVSDHGTRATSTGTATGRFGLVGMSERVRTLGGEFRAGPSDHGWCVEAVLPIGAGSESST